MFRWLLFYDKIMLELGKDGGYNTLWTIKSYQMTYFRMANSVWYECHFSILPQVLPSILVILDIEYWLQNDINSYTQHPSFKIKYE